MEILKTINLGLRFLLELASLVAWGYWGFHTGTNTAGKIVLGIGAPLLAAIIWGVFGAPASQRHLSGLALFLLEILVFGGSAVALAVAGQTKWALIFGILLILNRILMFVWGQ